MSEHICYYFLLIFFLLQLSLEDFTHHADVYNPSGDGGAFKNIKVFTHRHRYENVLAKNCDFFLTHLFKHMFWVPKEPSH